MKRVPKKENQKGEAEKVLSDSNIKRITFFDLDHTLIKSNCSALFGFDLYRNRVITLVKAVYLLIFYFLHKYGIISLKTLHQKSFVSIFKGKKQEFFCTLAAENVKKTFENQKNVPVVQLLEQARAEGDVYIVSASPDFIVKAYADLFGVTGFYATEYCVDENNKFSCIGCIADGEAKWEFAQTAIEGCYSVAYSDDEIDLPLLQNVDEGYLVSLRPSK